MNPEPGKATPAAATGVANAESKPSPIPPECLITYGVWKSDIEALCRALDAQQRARLDAQQRAHFRGTVREESNAAPLEVADERY